MCREPGTGISIEELRDDTESAELDCPWEGGGRVIVKDNYWSEKLEGEFCWREKGGEEKEMIGRGTPVKGVVVVHWEP